MPGSRSCPAFRATDAGIRVEILCVQAGEQKDPDAKRCKTEGAEGKDESPVKPKPEQAGSDSSVEDGGGQKPGKGKNAKPVEPPKDYVHVRARRGQATDSHSLAERVQFPSFHCHAPFQLVEFDHCVLTRLVCLIR